MHKEIHPPSPEGTHPSFASSGVYETECNMCGDTIRYTDCIDESYLFNGTEVGVRDVGDGSDLCPDCAREVGLTELDGIQAGGATC